MIVLFSLDISFDYNFLWSICCICSSTLQESFANGIECFVASVSKQNERNEQIGNEKTKKKLVILSRVENELIYNKYQLSTENIVEKKTCQKLNKNHEHI